MDKILIVEDETDINNMLCDALQKAGFECTQAFSGTEALLYGKQTKFSLILLDLMLPGMNGEKVLMEIRAAQSTPVIVVSAKDSLDSKVDLLNSGAEDYITKPFEIKVLIARVAVQIRRFSGQGEADVLQHGEITLNRGSFSVSVDGTDIPMTKQEFKILELLMSNPERVFSKQDIYDYAWEEYYIGEDKTINVHISNIRKKLKAVVSHDYIETVWGIGFKLARRPD